MYITNIDRILRCQLWYNKSSANTDIDCDYLNLYVKETMLDFMQTAWQSLLKPKRNKPNKNITFNITRCKEKSLGQTLAMSHQGWAHHCLQV